MTHFKRSTRILLLALAASVALAGCGGGDGSPRTSLKGMTVGYAEQLDTIDVADQFALEEVGAKRVQLRANQTAVTAVDRGNIDAAVVQFVDVALAIEEGGLKNIKILYPAELTIPFLFASQPQYQTLDDLAGQKVGYHAPGSLTETLPRLLFDQNAPEAGKSVDWTIVAGSAARATALRAGRLAAATLDYTDFVRLQQSGADITQLGTWTDLQGDASAAINTVWVVNKEFYDSSPDLMRELAVTIQKGYDRFYSDKAGWVAAAQEELASLDYPEEVLAATYDYYTEINEYPKSGTPGITEESLARMDSFFQSTGSYKNDFPRSAIDLKLIKDVAMGNAS
ncbi:hypothetical protein GCM10027062_42750 [Nocardioides hungaricus]